MGVERATRVWWAGTIVVVLVAVAAVIGGGIYLAVANTDLRAELSDTHDELSASQANAEELYQQLLDEGLNPEAEKPSEVAPPAAGATGERGTPGADGRDGVQGLPGVPGAAGPAGSPGADGEPGTPGPVGQDGADGAPGADGAAGSPGADGAPPLSWTFTGALGVRYVCTRTDPFDPTLPTYTCTTEGETP